MNSNGKTRVSDADHVQLERLVTEAAWRGDEGHSDTLYELFVEDGTLLLGNSELKGHDAIRNWGRQLERLSGVLRSVSVASRADRLFVSHLLGMVRPSKCATHDG